MSTWTLFVGYAFWWLEWNTFSVWVSSKTDVTRTLGDVAANNTVDVSWCTWIVCYAWVFAVSVLASSVQWTFRIRSATYDNATNKWITLISLDTSTVCFVGSIVTFSMGTTWIFQQTRWYACSDSSSDFASFLV